MRVDHRLWEGGTGPGRLLSLGPPRGGIQEEEEDMEVFLRLPTLLHESLRGLELELPHCTCDFCRVAVGILINPRGSS